MLGDWIQWVLLTYFVKMLGDCLKKNRSIGAWACGAWERLCVREKDWGRGMLQQTSMCIGQAGKFKR